MRAINKLILGLTAATIISIDVLNQLHYDSLTKQEKISYLKEQLPIYAGNIGAIAGPQFGGLFTAHNARYREAIQKKISELESN